MVDDAGGFAGAGLAEDREVLGRVAKVEGNVRTALQSGGVAKCGERASRLTDPEAEVARLAEVRTDGWRGIDALAQRQGWERLAVENPHQWPKAEAADDGRAREGHEPMRERIDERGRWHGAEGEHASRRRLGEGVTVEDAAS